MSYRSFLLLASAGIAIARTTSSTCEDLAAATGLLQADDGKTYCSSILDIGTVTNVVVESTTVLETTTITTPSEIALSVTATETETISSGTVTETAPLFITTETLSITTTAYACDSQAFRRDLGGNLVPYNAATTTRSPEPTPSVYEWDDEECEDEDEESDASPSAYNPHSMVYSDIHSGSAPIGYAASAPAAYNAHSMASSAAYPASTPSGHAASAPAPYWVHSMGSSAVYPASVPSSYAASPSTYGPMSSYLAHSTVSNDVKYPQASGNASVHHPSGTASSSYSLSTVLSDWRPQVSSNSTIPHPTGSLSSSHTIPTTSVDSTTPAITPVPTPEPSCETAPTALRTGFSCDTLSAACECLELPSATEDLTSTTTFTEAAYTTEAMLITTITELTETISITVPATTLTLTPSSTVTEDVLVTATSCPCSGSASSLCGSTPDTCRDLQTDTSNCGSCGNTCVSGEFCSAGTCVAPPAIPEIPGCAASSCGAWKTCGSGNSCFCAATAEGTGVCIAEGYGCSSYQRCSKSSECASPDDKCATSTCCGYGICIKVSQSCPNDGAAGRMFRRRTWDGETVGGGAF